MRALIVLVLALLASAPAAAGDPREEARRAFSAGQLADKAKDWDQAIKHYLRAFELVPHHFAAYNIGVDYEHLGQLREASIWFSRYLELAPQSPDRDKVMRLIVDLKLRPAKLTVRSAPSGATVFIDGQKVGVTPYERSIRGGGRRVAVELRGAREERDVVLEFGEPEVVEFSLAVAEERPVTVNAPSVSPAIPTDGETVIDVRGYPYGAHVAIDGQEVGTMPVRAPVTPGPHEVKVTRDGFTAFTTTITATESTATPVDVQLAVEGSTLPPFYYFIGGAAGADVRGNGTSYLLEVGIRRKVYDLTARAGKAVGETSVEVMARVGWGAGRFVPFVALGYSYLGGGPFYTVGAGVRVDLVQRPAFGASIVTEVGVRKFFRTETDPVTMLERTEDGTTIPILASLQLLFGMNKP